jgi:hypothetical protein
MGKKTKQALGDLKEMTRYWKLKEESLHTTLWRSRFVRGYGLVVRQTTKWMNEGCQECFPYILKYI